MDACYNPPLAVVQLALVRRVHGMWSIGAIVANMVGVTRKLVIWPHGLLAAWSPGRTPVDGSWSHGIHWHDVHADIYGVCSQGVVIDHAHVHAALRGVRSQRVVIGRSRAC